MRLKMKMTALALIATLAVYTALGAARSLRPAVHDSVPTEIYARFSAREESAEYFLKDCDGFVAVYEAAKSRAPETVTAIETASLRGADRAMIEKGIPVSDRQELLELLEDLGS